MFRMRSTTITSSSGRYRIMPSGNLQIADVRPSDQGVYTCIAINPLDSRQKEARHKVTLKVIAPQVPRSPRITWKPPDNIEAKKGSNVTLECVAEASPVPVISWNKYIGQLPEGRYKQDLGNLIIYNVQERDIGDYICQAVNGGATTTAQAVARVTSILEPPSIRVSPPLTQTVAEGSQITLPCLTQGKPSVRTTWLHNGVALIRGGDIQITAQTLQISKIRRNQAGMYQCFARSQLGMTHADAYVMVRPPGGANDTLLPGPDGGKNTERKLARIIQGPTNTSANSGDSVTLTCLTDGASRINWVKDERPLIGGNIGDDNEAESPNSRNSGLARMAKFGLHADEEAAHRRGRLTNENLRSTPRDARHMMRSSGELVVRNVTHSDRGLYTCVASNRNMFVKAAAYLTIVGGRNKVGLPPLGESMIPPKRPRVTEQTDTSVRLEWVVPPNNGLPIEFFKVQHRMYIQKEPVGQWRTEDSEIPANRRYFDILDLRPGATYRFRIIAVFTNKDNRNSPNSRRVTLGRSRVVAPSHPPFTHKVESTSPTSLSVMWQESGRDLIQGYYIRYREERTASERGPFLQKKLPRAQDSYTLTGLKPNTNYKVGVAAYNAKGQGPWSNDVVGKTAVDGRVKTKGPPELPGMPRKTTPSGVIIKQGPSGGGPLNPGSSKNTHTSNELLYMVLGIVLGVMVVFLIIIGAVCRWKQRKHTRNMDQKKGRKYKDPARMVHTDSLRKQYLNGNGGMYPINGLSFLNQRSNGTLPMNGSLRNGFVPSMTGSNRTGSLNSSRMNGNSHPPSEMEMDTLNSRHSNTVYNPMLYAQRTGSIDDFLPPPPPLHTFGKRAKSSKSDSGSRSGQITMSADHVPCYREPSNHSFDPNMMQAPPNYSSLSRDPSEDTVNEQYENNSVRSYDKKVGSVRGGSIRSPMFDPNQTEEDRKMSCDHIPRAYELKKQRSRGASDTSSSSSRRHRRRKRRSPDESGSEQGARDHGTLTDPSSSEGTMELPHGLPSPNTPESIYEEEAPSAANHQLQEDQVPPSPILPIHDLSRYKIQPAVTYCDDPDCEENICQTSPLMNRNNHNPPPMMNGDEDFHQCSPLMNRHLVNGVHNHEQGSPVVKRHRMMGDDMVNGDEDIHHQYSPLLNHHRMGVPNGVGSDFENDHQISPLLLKKNNNRLNSPPGLVPYPPIMNNCHDTPHGLANYQPIYSNYSPEHEYSDGEP